MQTPETPGPKSELEHFPVLPRPPLGRDGCHQDLTEPPEGWRARVTCWRPSSRVSHTTTRLFSEKRLLLLSPPTAVLASFSASAPYLHLRWLCHLALIIVHASPQSPS